MKAYITITFAVSAAAAAAVGMVAFFSSNNDNVVVSSLRHRQRRLSLIDDPRTIELKPHVEQLGEGQQCPRRDLSEFSATTIGNKFYEVPKTLGAEGANCLFFDCNHDMNECDNGDPTNYDGPKPPCCTHVLRDMSQLFDEEMCRLGLDYIVGFGALLGLHRADRFIPWSIDSDILIPNPETMNALVMLWDSKKTGMSPLFEIINRMCVNPDFAGGALMKWARPKCSEPGHFFYEGGCKKWDKKWDAGFPYMDLYLGHRKDDLHFHVHGDTCRHLYRDVFPTSRKPVYNGQFPMNFPVNPEQLLRTYYGKRWMFPPSDKEKKEHGGRMCPYGPEEPAE